ncbi:probable RNA-binding protein ARP1 isoform X2 [Phoenix dactylifera]|uniref:Probable RNA-binding protein ARP1 isoform X2 n=1 Tax=Phoenix dactylifera TaxID=42345 RepID=A0A8B7C5N4_PHODC|nr:probable RNA-binding protein ARP1 isoform X2 [Phoenix dactylifera]
MGQHSQFGDTTLTKVFVGGLAWETQKEALREHFDKYGEILEAVIISDKLTGRSKGYGFVTFKEAEAAKKACEDPTPVINGRRSNCNLASLGAKRLRPSHPATPALPSHHQPGMAVGSRGLSPGPAAPWYYRPSGTPPPPPSPFPHHHQHYHRVLPFYFTATYGYPPTYMPDMGYNAKLSQSAGPGSYIQGQFSYPPQGGGMVAPNGMLPAYPLYHFHHRQLQGMGVPAHFFPPAAAAAAAVAGTMAAVPTIISKPTATTPPPTVEQVKGCS